jgi:hypothetical protein
MPGSGTHTFIDPDQYEASLRPAQIELVATCGADFTARLTSVELHRLRTLRCEETFSRVGYLSLPPLLASVSFRADSSPPSSWRGAEVQADDIMFHSPGERLHQRLPGPSIWCLMIFDPTELDHYSRVLLGSPLALPPEGRVLRPLKRDAARLRRLHAQIVRLAETKAKILTHPEIARALEHDLMQALVASLTRAKVVEKATRINYHAGIMARFEEVLAAQPTSRLWMSELYALIGVGEPTLQSCCAEFLGMRASRYALLRRLREVRKTLRDADPGMVDLAALARCYGFTGPGRLAEAYRAAIRVGPSAGLRRAKPDGAVDTIFPKTA